MSGGRVLLYAPTLGQIWIVAGDRVPSADFVETDSPLQAAPKHLNLTLVFRYRCNLKCVYCYESHDARQELPIETAQQIARDLVKRHPDVPNLIVGYFGGEPQPAARTSCGKARRTITV